MPVNPELVGRDFPPTTPYLVGREKVREFARAVFATNPQHIDPTAAKAHGFADDVAPPTFAIVVTDATLKQLLERGIGHDDRFLVVLEGGVVVSLYAQVDGDWIDHGEQLAYDPEPRILRQV